VVEPTDTRKRDDAATTRRMDGARDGQPADLACEFLGVEPGADGGPVLGRQLELPILGPVGEDAEQVAKVRLGVEPLQPAGGDKREQVGGTLLVVAADKEPVSWLLGSSADALANLRVRYHQLLKPLRAPGSESIS